MIIDSHNHFWRYNSSEYAWIDDNMSVLKADFLTNDLKNASQAAGVAGTVAVQARQTLDETRFLLQLAEQDDFIKGVVGWVDLCADDVEQQLKLFTTNKKLKGIRHIVQAEPDENFLLRKDFNKGIEQLTKAGLTYDILIYPKHMKVAFEFAKRHPTPAFVLDHIAKPFIKKHELKPWQDDLMQLASLPNMYCKLSGLVTEANWHGHTYEDLSPYIEIAYQAFGEDRLMFGSDWPVCLLAADYDTVVGYVGEWLQSKPAAIQHKILFANAHSFYNL
jgi:L-fuconolactonase